MAIGTELSPTRCIGCCRRQGLSPVGVPLPSCSEAADWGQGEDGDRSLLGGRWASPQVPHSEFCPVPVLGELPPRFPCLGLPFLSLPPVLPAVRA